MCSRQLQRTIKRRLGIINATMCVYIYIYIYIYMRTITTATVITCCSNDVRTSTSWGQQIYTGYSSKGGAVGGGCSGLG